MKFLYFVVAFLLSCFSAVSAQQVMIANNPYADNYYSTGFDQRFRQPMHSQFSFTNLSLYKTTGVKKVEIHDAQGVLVFMLELDTAGKVTRQGYQHYYFVISETRMHGNEGYTVVTRYLQHGKVVRIDSSFSITKKYISGDTAMRYTQTTRTIIESGELINQRNAYFNETYLNKPYTPSEYSLSPVFTTGDKPDNRILLTKKLKTNYDSTLRLYSSQVTSHNFYAQVGKRHIPEDSLRHHFFAQQSTQQVKQKIPVDGADFEEPVEFREAFRCGSSYAREAEYNMSNFPGYTMLPNGLHATFINSYYPPDPDGKMPEGGAVVAPGWTPRKSEPIVTTLYTFRYTYF